jgi:hypothetical protein
MKLTHLAYPEAPPNGKAGFDLVSVRFGCRSSGPTRKLELSARNFFCFLHFNRQKIFWLFCAFFSGHSLIKGINLGSLRALVRV